MMFPKPEKKQKQQYQGLRPKSNKSKKEVAPWRRDLLSSHQSTPSKADRAEFPKLVVREAIELSKGICQCCGQAPCTTTHHVWGRGRGGRGVLKNAYRACGSCHINIESNDELKSAIIEEYIQLHGEYFWFDEQDWEEYDRKQTMLLTREEEQMKRRQRIAPVIDLLSTASGRELKAAEIRLIDGMDDGEMSVFAKMIADVVAASTPAEKHVLPFGYGHFDD